jgi:hypothetical protein
MAKELHSDIKRYIGDLTEGVDREEFDTLPQKLKFALVFGTARQLRAALAIVDTAAAVGKPVLGDAGKEYALEIRKKAQGK